MAFDICWRYTATDTYRPFNADDVAFMW